MIYACTFVCLYLCENMCLNSYVCIYCALQYSIKKTNKFIIRNQENGVSFLKGISRRFKVSYPLPEQYGRLLHPMFCMQTIIAASFYIHFYLTDEKIYTVRIIKVSQGHIQVNNLP